MVRRRLVVLLVACLVALTAPALAPASAAAPVQPLLTGIRASHHPGFDRVVFDFYGGVPTSRRAEYVRAVIAPSGMAVPVAGRAILQVTFQGARGHKDDGTVTAPSRVAFALPNVLTAVQGEDFEAVLTYGIGVARRALFRVSTLNDPPRVVVDIDTNFTWVNRPVWFFDEAAFVANDPPFFVPRMRPVTGLSVGHALMDRLYAGVTESERARALRFLASGSTFYSHLTVDRDAVGRVRIRGGCSSGGATVSIAGEIIPTLRQHPKMSWVKVLDPLGRTGRPTGQVDSVPECLEP
jgi:hypothetical protein